MRCVLVVLLVTLLSTTPALAFKKLDGYFIALEVCEAYQSKNKLTNPGHVETEPHRAYDIKGINKEGGDFFQMVVPGSPVTRDRWVHVDCGVHVVRADTATGGTGGGSGGQVEINPPPGSESSHHLLALSWQPAFCESRPSKTECRQLNDGLLPVTETQLSIHGLWPQPRGNDYCGVPKALINLDKARRWSELPEVPLDPETREALEVAMPGTASFLERHEWIKHGTCHLGEGGADEYYRDTLLLTEAINASAIGAFFANHVGAEVRTQDIRDLFDAEFGAGAGQRVQFQCAGDGGRTLIQELKIHMRGVIGEDSDPGGLLLAGDTVSLGCASGVIDPSGLQ